MFLNLELNDFYYNKILILSFHTVIFYNMIFNKE
jgi:hypothetical protein